MLFNSYVFMLAFLPLTLIIYFLLGKLPERIQLNKVFLVLASFVVAAIHVVLVTCSYKPPIKQMLFSVLQLFLSI